MGLFSHQRFKENLSSPLCGSKASCHIKKEQRPVAGEAKLELVKMAELKLDLGGRHK